MNSPELVTATLPVEFKRTPGRRTQEIFVGAARLRYVLAESLPNCGACDDTARIPMLGGGSMPCVRCRKGQDQRLDFEPNAKGANEP